jgi:hypothetical protein
MALRQAFRSLVGMQHSPMTDAGEGVETGRTQFAQM